MRYVQRLVRLRKISNTRTIFEDVLVSLAKTSILIVLYYFVVRTVFGEIGDSAFIVITGLVFWIPFMSATLQATSILIERSAVIRSVPLRASMIGDLVLISNAAYFAIQTTSIAILLAVFGVHDIVSLIMSLALYVMVTRSIVSIMSVIGAYHMRIRAIWRFLLHVGFWFTPVVYTLERFDGWFESLLALSPVSVSIELFRASVGMGSFTLANAIPSMIVTAFIGILSILLLRIFYSRAVDQL